MTTKQFNRNTNASGGFKVLRRYGEPLPTRKATERIAVQAVEAGDRKWLEARLLFQKDGTERWTPTKQAISFASVEQTEAFIDAIEAGLQDAASLGLWEASEPPVEEAEEEIEVVAVKPRSRAFSDEALIPEDDD